MMKKLVLVIMLAFLVINMSCLEKSHADIPVIVHFGYFYSGFDAYYKVNIIGYLENSLGAIAVTVRNDLNYDVNLTRIKIVFEWGDVFAINNLTIQLPRGLSRVFILEFTIPSIGGKITNLRPYTYYVEVEYVYGNETGVWRYTPENYFVIFNSDQRDYYNLKREFESLLYSSIYFTRAKAKEMYYKAIVERDLGDLLYSRGSFKEAVAKYKNAIDLLKQAVSLEYSIQSVFEEISLNRSIILLKQDELQLENIKSQINYYNSQIEVNRILAEAESKKADAELKKAEAELISALNVKYYAYAIMIYGFGFIIISIGILIYLAKKAK